MMLTIIVVCLITGTISSQATVGWNQSCTLPGAFTKSESFVVVAAAAGVVLFYLLHGLDIDIDIFMDNQD